MGISGPVLSQISILGSIRPCLKPSSWKARNGLCVYCTDKAITLLSSSYPYLPFDINIALVQTLYHGDIWPGIVPNFHCWPYTAPFEPKYLEGP